MIDSTSIREILKTKGSHTWTVTPETSVYDAIQLMAEKNIGALVVTAGGKVLGLISERDYTRKVVLHGKSSKSTPVRAIIADRFISVTPDHTVESCLRLMTEHRIRHLPVLEDGQLKGVISIGDLVNWIISAQRSTIEQLQTYISGVPG